jgi:hypothetical protein
MLRQTSERKVAPTFHDEIFTRLRFPKQYQFCGPGKSPERLLEPLSLDSTEDRLVSHVEPGANLK